MAKAVGLGSQFRGKIGSYVGFLTKNRRGRYVQSVKAYQPVVSNPQTLAQALARIPLGPTQRFFNVLSALISRGFEGVAYGEPSKQEFLSLNLSNYYGPYLTKGDVIPRPGPFLIANGSLAQINCFEFDDTGDYSSFCTSIHCTVDIEWSSKRNFVDDILAKNPNFNYGDQLTFCWCCVLDGQYNYHWASLFLQYDDDDTWERLQSGSDSQDGVVCFVIDHNDVVGFTYGAAVIRSCAYGDASFKRSIAYFCLNNLVYQYNDQAALMAAARSYMESSDDDDAWPYDPIPELEQIAYICMVPIDANYVTYPYPDDLDGKQCLGFCTKGGVFGVFYTYQSTLGANVLLDSSAQTLLIQHGSQRLGVVCNSDYPNAREYSEVYGKLNA